MSKNGKSPPRRTYSPEFKVKLVLQLLTKEKTAAELAREHGLRDTQIHVWRQEFLERSARVFAPDPPSQEDRKLANLERLVGQQSLEIAILKRALDR